MAPLARSCLLVGVCALLPRPVRAAAGVVRPKFVMVAMFEAGADTGDVPWEFQVLAEREKPDRIIPLPKAFHDVRATGAESNAGERQGVYADSLRALDAENAAGRNVFRALVDG